MKFILLASNASVMAMTRLPIGKLRDDPDLAALFSAAYQEVVDVGRASRRHAAGRRRRPHAQLQPQRPAASDGRRWRVDLLRGNRIELPWLSGKVVELGRQLGVPTPAHALMYAALKPYVMGTPA